MNIYCFDSKCDMGRAAAAKGVEAIPKDENAAIIVATGASQFDTLSHLVRDEHGIDWSKITAFHLDEYVGLPDTHPASFRKYLKERFADELPKALKRFYLLNAETNPEAECKRVGRQILRNPISVAFVGIGENGHLAFNDPPADFEIEVPYHVVELDKPCRKQQVGEGWFKKLADVPTHAISMTIKQIMKSDRIICTVPDLRKAEAVKNSVEGPVTPEVPASILQEHPDCHLFLDRDAASLLSGNTISASLVES